jgi:tetratricopeptide (TPR) repeat protein
MGPILGSTPIDGLCTAVLIKTLKMRRAGKTKKPKKARRVRASTPLVVLKRKGLAERKSKEPPRAIVDPAAEQQLKAYEEGVQHFHQQKYLKAKPIFEKVIAGPGKELADRARVHLRIVEQRLQRTEPVSPRTPEEHYQQGVAMMNMGRWDEAREHLLRARKLAPKADYVIYAMAALDCLTGEAESAMENLKLAIQLRPENRYHARNDEDFAFLQEDPRFTELLYPDRDGSGS